MGDIQNFFTKMNDKFLSNAPRSQGGVNWKEYGSVNTHTLKGFTSNPNNTVVVLKTPTITVLNDSMTNLYLKVPAIIMTHK